MTCRYFKVQSTKFESSQTVCVGGRGDVNKLLQRVKWKQKKKTPSVIYIIRNLQKIRRPYGDPSPATYGKT